MGQKRYNRKKVMTILNDLLALLAGRTRANCLAGIHKFISRAYTYGGQYGVRSIVLKLSRQASPAGDYGAWVQKFDTIGDRDRSAIQAHIRQLPYRPLISVLLPVYNTPEPFLRKAINSVRAQLYPDWELCVADDGSTLDHVRTVLDSYRLKDQRIKVLHRPSNGHISAASNSALDMATGEFVALLDHDDELSEHALYMVAARLNEYPDADLLYSDEDKIDARGMRFDPFFKSDWNPDLLSSQNFIGHLGVYRTASVRKVGGFRTGYEGSQDYDLILRLSEQTSPNNIQHIPFILYHWRAIPGSIALGIAEKPYATEASQRGLQAHFDRLGITAECTAAGAAVGHFRAVYALPDPLPFVTLVIWINEGGGATKYLAVLSERTPYKAMEILLVGNPGSGLEAWTDRRGLTTNIPLKVICPTHADSLASLCNHAAVCARGDVLVFLDAGLEPIDSGWLHELVTHAVRAEIGAVGAKLYDRDVRVQHAGFILGVGRHGVPHTYHRFLPRTATGNFNRACLIQNVSAVSMNCMALSHRLFHEIGGFDADHLADAYADIDLCLRLRERGYRILWTPYAELRQHHQPAEAQEPAFFQGGTLPQGLAYMRTRWGERWAGSDPYYNPNLDPESGAFALATPPRIHRPWVLRSTAVHGHEREAAS